MIEPEIRHHLVQLAFAVDGAQQFRLHQFIGDHLLGMIQGLQGFFLLRIHALHEILALRPFERRGERALLVRRHLENLLHALVCRQVQQFLRLAIRIEAILTPLREFLRFGSVLG